MTPVTKVLLGLGLLLVVAVVLVAGAVIYATWFDSRQDDEASIVPDEDMPNITKEDVSALADSHFLIQGDICRLKLCNTRLAWPRSGSQPPPRLGEGTSG